MTPLVPMHTLGHSFVPPKIHAGGLRYHGAAPLVSHLVQEGEIEARAYEQVECFEAGVQFARPEGIVPAPEANHVVKGVVEEALRCRESGEAKVIAFILSGHGHFDTSAYQAYFQGNLEVHHFADEMLERNMAELEGLPTL